MLFSVFSQRGGKHQHLKVSPQIFMFEALSLDLPGEAFLRPHLLIMRQYLIFQLKQEYYTVSVFEHHLSWQLMNFLSSTAPAFCCARCTWPHCSSRFQWLWGFGVGLFHLCTSAIFVLQTELIYFSRQELGTHSPGKADQRGWHWPLVSHMKGSGVSCPLPWVPMAFKTLLIQTSWWGRKFAALRVLSMSHLEWNGTFYNEH